MLKHKLEIQKQIKRRRLLELLARVRPTCLEVEVTISNLQAQQTTASSSRELTESATKEKILNVIIRTVQIDKVQPMGDLQIATDTAAAAEMTKIVIMMTMRMILT